MHVDRCSWAAPGVQLLPRRVWAGGPQLMHGDLCPIDSHCSRGYADRTMDREMLGGRSLSGGRIDEDGGEYSPSDIDSWLSSDVLPGAHIIGQSRPVSRLDAIPSFSQSMSSNMIFHTSERMAEFSKSTI